MADYVVPGIVIGAVATVVLYAALQHRTVFTLTIKDGRVEKVRGHAPDGYIRDVERMCAFWSIREGTIRAVRGAKRTRIYVGGGITRQHRQVFQNAWNYPV